MILEKIKKVLTELLSIDGIYNILNNEKER